MKQLVIASNNAGKIREIKALLPNVDLLSLTDIGFTEEIPEPFDTFRENAQTKAETIHRFCGLNVFADDSGICVDALGGAPGVFSARYAGEPKDDQRNLQKVLDEIKDAANRNAHYTAVICLVWEGRTCFFEGECHGRLIDTPRGTDGFGYDPAFVPDGYEQTFAELPLDVKNSISHRGRAVRAMVEFLNETANVKP